MKVSDFVVEILGGRETESGHVELVHGTVYQIRLVNWRPDRRVDAYTKVDGKDVGAFRLNPREHLLLERPSHDTGCFTFYKLDSPEASAVGAGSVERSERGLVQVTFRVEKEQPVVKHVIGSPLRPTSKGGYRPQSAGGSDRTEAQYKSRSFESEEKTAGGIPTPTGVDLQAFGPEDDAAKGLDGYSRSYGPGGQHVNSNPSLRRFSAPAPGVTGLSGKSSQTFVTVENLTYDPALETVITLRLVAVEDSSTPRPLTSVLKGNPIPEAIG